MRLHKITIYGQSVSCDVTTVTDAGQAWRKNGAMKSLRKTSLLIAALLLPGGVLLLMPMALRAVGDYRRKRAALAKLPTTQ